MPTMEEKLKSACQARCSEFGEPACYIIVADEPGAAPWAPCSDCKADCGIEADPEPLDPAAVMRPLI